MNSPILTYIKRGRSVYDWLSLNKVQITVLYALISIALSAFSVQYHIYFLSTTTNYKAHF